MKRLLRFISEVLRGYRGVYIQVGRNPGHQKILFLARGNTKFIKEHYLGRGEPEVWLQIGPFYPYE